MDTAIQQNDWLERPLAEKIFMSERGEEIFKNNTQ